MRWFLHLFSGAYVRHHFPPAALDAIAQAISAGERRHTGQVCFAIEGALAFGELLRRRTPRERAHEVFARLGVWDTEHNSGVLIYVLLADRAIEIVADCGITARVAQPQWEEICAQMQKHFSAGEFERGALTGIESVHALLEQHFPVSGQTKTNELSDRPVVL